MSRQILLAVKDEHGQFDVIDSFDTIDEAMDAAIEHATMGLLYVNDANEMTFGIKPHGREEFEKIFSKKCPTLNDMQ